MQDSMFIGLDVHKATISVAIARGERGGEVLHCGTIPHRPDHIRKLVERLGTRSGAGEARLHFCYEAGPCGYGLHRQLVEMGHDCRRTEDDPLETETSSMAATPSFPLKAGIVGILATMSVQALARVCSLPY